MSPVTRVELNARLETIEVRLDGRIAALESSVKDVQNSISNLKSTILWAAVTSVIAIAAFNATVLANMVASFEAGKDTSDAQAEIRRQTDETARILREIQAQLAEQKKTNRLKAEPPAGG